MPRIGTTEIIVVAIVILVLFGGKKIPELVKGIAMAIKEFRNAFSEKGKE